MFLSYILRPKFSPHAWGWTAEATGGFEADVVFPTRVGVDRCRTMRKCIVASFPHTRGGGPNCSRVKVSLILFSPHAWGWTGIGTLPSPAGKVFPTRVGVDRTESGISIAEIRFPHTRGGGPALTVRAELTPTFSPHAWGWTV